MTKLFSLFALSILMSSCYYDLESELYPGPCEVPEVPTYSADIQLIIAENCSTSGCHDSGGNAPGNFMEFAGLQAKVNDGSFEQEVLINLAMPPSGGLSQCELTIIETWIANGAAE
jgi:hypothetical protein